MKALTGKPRSISPKTEFTSDEWYKMQVWLRNNGRPKDPEKAANDASRDGIICNPVSMHEAGVAIGIKMKKP